MNSFKHELPWSEAVLSNLVDALSSGGLLEVTWWWEPFHRVGFDSLKFAAHRHFSAEVFDDIIADLSCPAAPKHLLESLREMGGVDEEDRIKSLDAERNIRETWSATGKEDLGIFEAPDLILPTIRELRQRLKSNTPAAQPVLESMSEYRIVSNFLTKTPRLLKRFQALSSWDKLEFIESLLGIIISSSKLKFEHLDD